MIALTTWTGGILTATGLIAYFTTGMESATSLIPAFIGVLLLIAAFIASRVPNASRGVMIAALVIAVLAALVAATYPAYKASRMDVLQAITHD